MVNILITIYHNLKREETWSNPNFLKAFSLFVSLSIIILFPIVFLSVSYILGYISCFNSHCLIFHPIKDSILGINDILSEGAILTLILILIIACFIIIYIFSKMLYTTLQKHLIIISPILLRNLTPSPVYDPFEL